MYGNAMYNTNHYSTDKVGIRCGKMISYLYKWYLV